MNDARESSRRLADLLLREHRAMGDFLVALADFDRRRLWLQLGHSGLFYFLHRELGLSKGAAYYRKAAAQLIQRFPEVIEPLTDGRLCLTSVVELARVMTAENRAEVLPRFFHRSKREAKEVAVEICPAAVVPRREVVARLVSGPARPAEVHPDEPAATHPGIGIRQAAAAPPPRREAEETLQSEPLTSDLRRLHVTVSKRFIDKLESARAGQSHAQPGATAEQVLEAALDLLLAHQARRRGAATTPRKVARPAKPDHVPAAVRRAVWARDQSRCTWPLAAGGTCDSTLRLEIDHVVPRARGGAPTVSNLRILCAVHNALAARQVYGDAWMDRFTGRAGEGKPGHVPVAREPAAAWGWLPHPSSRHVISLAWVSGPRTDGPASLRPARGRPRLRGGRELARIIGGATGR
jgi:5-methylcytosine-specific restriction endonuclease McrA